MTVRTLPSLLLVATLAAGSWATAFATVAVAEELPAGDDECTSPDCSLGMLQRRAFRQQDVPAPANETSEKSSGAGACFSRPPSDNLAGAELCFCQLAGNPACADTACACPQGCAAGVAWKHANTVVFRNVAKAHGCADDSVLLTSPSGYFRDPADLHEASGGSCQHSIITQLLADSWSTYQSAVGTGPVWQCFHGSHIASVRYLHLQTFCHSGSFHGMPTSNHYVASCVLMSAAGQAEALAARMASMIVEQGSVQRGAECRVPVFQRRLAARAVRTARGLLASK
eukprot:CAMPEP_0176201582 /NCGR_PEP_ID=MMETSP0121_2-20121125/9640_1 /TAXON_ID=160619 /ORGANISM="Kryptoperidinium foliaceum, Strain CCMP 1326" /LENGTH=284 /DNA_ID=CAMNT_0017540463 /DNA_START=64 /DNA_END=919 /DNA_ORIENTATION=+